MTSIYAYPEPASSNHHQLVNCRPRIWFAVWGAQLQISNVFRNRYHSKQTLKTMKAYRIGRKQGTWVNRTPPIRGGVFVKANPIVDSSSSSETEEDSADDGVSQISSLCSCGISHKDAKEGLRHRGPCPTQSQGPNQKPSAHTQVANAALEREIQNDLTIYPSLDPLVQKEIARKYQILHQQITDAGLYDCPYLDYGKEMIRYTLLFTTFIVLLSYGWYLTSAIFLGLFWVCPHPHSLKSH